MLSLRSILLSLLVVLAVGCSSTQKWKMPAHSVEKVGTLQFDSGVRSRFGGHSTLWNGKLLWLFADTKLNYKGLNRRGTIDSAAAFLSVDKFRQGSLEWKEVADGIEFLPLTTEESLFNKEHFRSDLPPKMQERHVLRPGPAFVSPDGGTLYILYSHTIRDGFDKPDPVQGGLGIATWQSGAPRPVRPTKLLFPYHDICLDDAAMVNAGFLYLFGARHEEEHGWCVRVGRVRFKDLQNRDEWKFWDGETWNYEATKAKPILENAAPHFSIHWNSFLSRYICVYAQPGTRNVMFSTSDYPVGPWSEPILLTTLPEETIAAAAHRALQRENGRIEIIAASCKHGDKTNIHILKLSFPTIPTKE